MKSTFVRHCFITALILLTAGCGRQSLEDIRMETITDTIPDQETWNFSLILSSGGLIQADVKAGHMVKYSNKNYYELSDSVVVNFFNKNGGHSSVLYSDSGIVEADNSRMTVNGNVKAVSDNGAILLSDELMWTEEKKKIFTDKFVTIYSKGDTVHGYGFESEQELKKWKIFKPFGITDRKIMF